MTKTAITRITIWTTRTWVGHLRGLYKDGLRLYYYHYVLQV